MLGTSDKDFTVRVAAATNQSFMQAPSPSGGRTAGCHRSMTSRHLKALGAAIVQQLQAWKAKFHPQECIPAIGKVADDWWILLRLHYFAWKAN
jgi:hypothetical protein